jgi:hypothetical protein
MSRVVKLFAVAAALATVAPATAHAGLLINPSFEQPALPPGTFRDFTAGNTIGAGWVVQSGDAQVITNNFSPTWPNATDGNQIAYLGQNLQATTVYQDVSLNASTAYRLTFDLSGFSQFNNGNGALLKVDILSGGQSILGGPVTFTRPEPSQFAGEVLEFTSGSSGSYRLILNQPGGHGTNVDNFSLTLASVPEPSSLTLGCVGAGIVTTLLGYRRSRSAMHVSGTCTENGGTGLKQLV